MTRPAYQFIRCPNHPGRNVVNHPCDVCGYSPPHLEGGKTDRPLSLVKSDKDGSAMQAVADTKARVESETYDPETGEIPGQLTLCGLELDSYEVQRRAQVPGISLDAWIAVYHGLEEGDKVTAVKKDGLIIAKITAAWGRA
jgi:hypothetical protein